MSKQPTWLKEFANRACACLHALEEMPPIGCHVAVEEATWEVSLFVSSTEIVGGRHDGERLACLFVVDLAALFQLFDMVESASWQPHPFNEQDELRNHVSVEGYVEGHHVGLRILADLPDRFAPGRYLNLHDQNFLDTWLT